MSVGGQSYSFLFVDAPTTCFGMEDDPVFVDHCSRVVLPWSIVSFANLVSIMFTSPMSKLKVINSLTEFLACFEERYLPGRYLYGVTSFRVSCRPSIPLPDCEAT